jgi:hypothetical protein
VGSPQEEKKIPTEGTRRSNYFTVTDRGRQSPPLSGNSILSLYEFPRPLEVRTPFFSDSGNVEASSSVPVQTAEANIVTEDEFFDSHENFEEL